MTIVLAVGLTRGWRTALSGVAAGLVTLAIIVGIFGPALVDFVPLRALQVLVGTLLLIFGMQWLRKAILRASGRKAMHDEDLIFQTEVDNLGNQIRVVFDWSGFVVAYKGVFLEGLEVAFIVLTFGANAGRFGPSIAGALAAVLLVTVVGIVSHRPLSNVPENAIKFTVGIALTAFGTFWGGEGAGLDWRFGDLMLPLLFAIYAAAAWGLVKWLRGDPEGSDRMAGASAAL